jgi:nucleoside-diphosphate-sugar epimerase
MARPTILIAGASGDLGARIGKALVARGVNVGALVRAELTDDQKEPLAREGLTILSADVTDVGSVAAACEGARCVISALNGLHDVIVGRQSVLLDGAVKAGVPRFIPSDFSVDFTRTEPGHNRNSDLRREFMVRADRAPIQITSILNGAFMDLLGAEMPIIQKGIRRVLYWGSADQKLDFTTKDNVAAFTAAAALDDTTPRILRIAGNTVSAREIAQVMSEVSGAQYRTLYAGNISTLGLLIRLAKIVAPQPSVVFPPWQGMQYMRDMFSGRGRLQPLDNARYPNLGWTSVREQLAATVASALRG